MQPYIQIEIMILLRIWFHPHFWKRLPEIFEIVYGLILDDSFKQGQFNFIFDMQNL